MSKKIIISIAIAVLCGSAFCRPTNAYFSSHAKSVSTISTADWRAPRTRIAINNQAISLSDSKIDPNWYDCTTLEIIGGSSPNYGIFIEAGTMPVCITKNLSFELHQLRTINLKYQLFAAPLLELEKQPLVRIYWNDIEIAWLSHITTESSWLSLTIPDTAETGKLSIKISPFDLQITTQLIIESLTFQRFVVTPMSNSTLTSDEAQITVFYIIDNSTGLRSGQSPISLNHSYLGQIGALTFWSVDSWGNTEAPKTIDYQVITNQVDSPKIIWQYYQDGKLNLVVETNVQSNLLVKKYQLITDAGVLDGKLEQPWISSAQELHQPGTPVSISFIVADAIHVGRVQSIDQFGNESVASDLILF